jgi:predicted exporter
VPLTVNGQAAGSKTASADGSVNIVITVTSTSAAEINDPVSVPINCGSNNSFSASGPGAEIATTNSAGNFTVQCSATNTNLVKTGVNVLKYLVVALVLICTGTALVVLQRRRAHAG